MKSNFGLRGSLVLGIALWGLFVLAAGAQTPSLPEAPALLGVKPGVTTLEGLKQIPAFQKVHSQSRLGEFDVYTYQIPEMPDYPFVQLLTKEEKVEVVVINLKEPRLVADARTSFRESTGNYKPILIQDAEGKYREVYPETGVSFVLKKNEEAPEKPGDQVVQIVMEQVKPDFFLVRADENRRKLFAEGSIAGICSDAEKVLQLDPKNASAYWLLGVADFLIEDYAESLRLVSQAVQLNDRVPEYHFLIMNLLERTNAVDNGLRYYDAVQDLCKTNPFHAAQLAILHAALLTKKSDGDRAGAINELQETIDRLKTLATESKTDREKLMTLQLTARAYMALGSAIAAKDWQDPAEKKKSYLWFKAAKVLLDNILPRDPTAAISLFDLWRTASEAALADPENTELDAFLADLPATADKYLAQVPDTLEEEMVRIKTGETFFNAFLAADTRGDAAAAEKYALSAYEYLQASLRQDSERVAQIIGPVDYELGIYFNELPAHKEIAAGLLAHAAETISSAITSDGSAQDGDQGIRLVNIGKAYWIAGDREKGESLTRRGVDAIEKAVTAGNFPREEFSVPCQNLITIYEALGDSAGAGFYREKLSTLLEGGAESH
ncbi:MAG: hypothetical protein J6S42_03420 [Thermoguttaceae bacterium]|nr:hypothetical protein [Thermoguttaceae bacterium]